MANAEPGKCAQCKRALPAQSGQGRLRRYCDATCRSAARRARTPQLQVCDVRIGDWHACGQPADGEVRHGHVRGGTLAHVCTGHRAMVEQLLTERFGRLAWVRYAVAGRSDADVVDEDQDHAAAAAAAAWFTLSFSAADGWELHDGAELLAGHDGIEADHVDQAREWAAAELADAYGVTVTAWRGDPDRRRYLALA